MTSTGDSLPLSPVLSAAPITFFTDASVQSETRIMSAQSAKRGSLWISSSLMTPGGQTWSPSGSVSIEKKAELSRTLTRWSAILAVIGADVFGTLARWLPTLHGADDAVFCGIPADDRAANVAVGSSGGTAVISEYMSMLIVAGAANAGAADDFLSVAITTSATTVTMPKGLLHDAKVKDVTIAMGGATIVSPKTAVADYDTADSISLSVADSPAPISADIGVSGATRPFELNLGGSNTSEFNGLVTVSVDRSVPAGATNVRFYCIDEPTEVSAAVAGGTVTGMLPHFSTWTIVYDMPAVIIDDGDELPPSWNYVPQHQVRGSQTTTIMAVCAAAVAAIAVAIAAFVVVKKV